MSMPENIRGKTNVPSLVRYVEIVETAHRMRKWCGATLQAPHVRLKNLLVILRTRPSPQSYSIGTKFCGSRSHSQAGPLAVTFPRSADAEFASTSEDGEEDLQVRLLASLSLHNSGSQPRLTG